MVTILATIDGSSASVAVLPFLVRLAPDIKMKVCLLSVAAPVTGTPWPNGRVPFVAVSSAGPGIGPVLASISQRFEQRWAESDEQALERALAETRDFLAEAAKPLRAAGIEVETAVVMDKSAANAIISYAKKEGVDLIAMSTHGWSAVNKLVQGSVAAAVLRSGVAPVLLVRPQALSKPLEETQAPRVSASPRSEQGGHAPA